MAQDPYGYAETNAVSGNDATISLWLGIAALICGVAAPCCCYVGWAPALPLAVLAIWYGLEAASAPDAAARTSAAAGLVSGGVALCFAMLYLAIVSIYVLIFSAAAFSD
jgi:hypothetical protein